MAPAPDRTAAFTAIRSTPFNDINPHEGRNITHTVAIPGLTARDGGPLTVKRTYTIDEISHDWVSVTIDFEFGDAPVVFGNHPLAIGPLREILPEAIPWKPMPKTQRAMRDAVVRMLAQHDLGGWVLAPVVDSRTLEIKPPSRISTDSERRRWFNTIQEYFPFQADIWWDDDNERVRVRPQRENRETHIVHTA
jgi:hypothetical protein